MREYYDIPNNKDWIEINKINKGWSADKKFYIRTIDNKELLLKISDISEYDKKKDEFKNIKLLNNKDILMSSAIDFGICNNGKSVYSLFTWIEGQDADIIINELNKEEQYNLGFTAGRYLKEIHSIATPSFELDWDIKFNAKIDKKISSYKGCGINIEGADKIIAYLQENRNLLSNRPQCFQHGDYHINNMIITPSKELGIIDFNRFDYGDPLEEFNRIVWSAEASPEFASGCINGYFNNEVPEIFFRLMLLYILSNVIGSISWAIPFGQEEVNVMIGQTKNVLGWYKELKSYIPNWYITKI